MTRYTFAATVAGLALLLGCSARVEETPDSNEVIIETPDVDVNETPDLDPSTDDDVDVKIPGGDSTE